MKVMMQNVGTYTGVRLVVFLEFSYKGKVRIDFKSENIDSIIIPYTDMVLIMEE